MTDTPAEPIVPVVAPVADTPAPVPEPVVAQPEAPKPAEAAPVEPVPEPVVDALKPHTETATLLEEVAKTAEAKDGVKPEGDKTAEPPKPETPEPIKFEAYKVPEGFKIDEQKMGELNEILAKQLPPQELGQALLDRHVAELQKYNEQVLRQQHEAFAQTRAQWVKDVMADEELGGSGWNTTRIAVAKMRDLFVPEARRAAFNDFLRVTGAGDHPEFLRLLNNVARKFDEPAGPTIPYNPPPDLGRKPNAKGGRLRDFYTNGKP